jgi:general secretion pathway protein D
MKVDQSVKQASEATVRAEQLRDIATIISDRSLKTNIVVGDRDTIVLGGLIRDEEARSETKIPFLGDLPVVGWLFKSSSITKKKINLLVFLTPKIIRNTADSRRLLGLKISDRDQWVRANVLGDDPFAEKVRSISKQPEAVDSDQPVPEIPTSKPDPKQSSPESEETPAPKPTATPSPTPSPSPSDASATSTSPDLGQKSLEAEDKPLP